MAFQSLTHSLRTIRPRSVHFVAVAAVAALSACQPTMGGGGAPAPQTLQVVDTQTGTITGVQQVAAGGASGLNRAGGAFSGAVVGGLIGNQFGEGSGNDVMTAVGVLGGAVAGDALARQMNTQTIPQWTVRLDNGRTVAVASNVAGLRVGSRVRVQQLSNGELRIGPL